MPANTRQIGGDHYKGTYQHWDFVIDTNLDYLLGCVTKYLSRFRKKNGVEDLKKARHYLEKFIEKFGVEPIHKNKLNTRCIEKFIKENKLSGTEEAVALKIIMGQSEVCTLEDVLYSIDTLLEELEDGSWLNADNTGQEHPFGYDEKVDNTTC